MDEDECSKCFVKDQTVPPFFRKTAGKRKRNEDEDILPGEKGMMREACFGRRRWACAPCGPPSSRVVKGKKSGAGSRNLEPAGGNLSGGRVLRLPVELGTSRLGGGGGFQSVLLCNVNWLLRCWCQT